MPGIAAAPAIPPKPALVRQSTAETFARIQRATSTDKGQPVNFNMFVMQLENEYLDGDDLTGPQRAALQRKVDRYGSGSVNAGPPAQGKADLTISVKDADFMSMQAGKLNPQSAFMSGKIKIKGNMGLAMKLGTVLNAAKAQANL